MGKNWQVVCSDGYGGQSDRSLHQCSRIWLSTGTRFDATSEPLLTEILQAYPIPLVQGLPILDTHLRWRGCELFIMGGLAALQTGPTARNLSLARMTSQKIVPAIIKPSIALSQKRSA